MKSLRLIFGTYNHQPEGNLPELFERAYQSAYKPFLSLLYNHPRLPVVLYYCGSLFEWLEEHHPEFMMLLREMVRRKQVELLGGGFYSPILSLLPDGDKLGQIEKLTTYLRTTFGVRPRGGWLTERVWEPPLARILRNSGLEYTFLDDRHFHIAGIGPEDCFGPYLAEEQGKTIQVLPIRNALVEMVPLSSPAEMLQSLRDLAREQGGRVAVLLRGRRAPGGAGGQQPHLLPGKVAGHLLRAAGGQPRVAGAAHPAAGGRRCCSRGAGSTSPAWRTACSCGPPWTRSASGPSRRRPSACAGRRRRPTCPAATSGSSSPGTPS